jgi:limonene-1,2-epoxide hydrolase
MVESETIFRGSKSVKKSICLLVLVSVITCGCTPATSSSDAEKLRVANEMVEAWNRLDWDRVFELFAEDGVLHTMTSEPIVGRAAIRERLQYIVDNLESIELRITHMGIIDDVVMIERVDDFVFAGRHSAIPVVGVMEIADGKVTEWREYYDRETLARSLSLAPDRSAEEQAIRATVARMSEVWNAGDMAGYFELYVEDEETTLAFADRITSGWQPIRDMFGGIWSTPEAMGQFTTKDLAVRFLGDDLAVATGIYQHQFPDEYVEGAFSLFFRKQGNDWKITHEHTSRGRTTAD